MYTGVIRNRDIVSLNTKMSLIADKKFIVLRENFLPPLFSFSLEYNTNTLYFINKLGIFVIYPYCYQKLQTIKKLFELFQKKKFEINFQTFEKKIEIAMHLFQKNNINIYFYKFNKLFINSKNIEIYTNLSKDTINLLQALNSTFPYP